MRGGTAALALWFNHTWNASIVSLMSNPIEEHVKTNRRVLVLVLSQSSIFWEGTA